MVPQSVPFLLGVSYWPRRKAFRWWSAFERNEVRDEFAQVAAIGCNSVRLSLRWEDFQPAPQRINSRVLRALEQALDAAAEANLRVTLTLFPVALGGALHLPRWASHPDPLHELQQLTRFGRPLIVQPAATPPVIYEWGYHANESHDLFSDPALREAQCYLTREVVGYFGAHPTIACWQIGEGLERVRKPDSDTTVRDWYAELGEVVHAAHSHARVLGVTSPRGLTTRTGPRPEQLAQTCDMVGVAADTRLPLPGQQPIDLDALIFLHALTTALAGKPAAVVGLGQPTAPDHQRGWIVSTAYGRSTQTYLAGTDEQAEFIASACERLYQAGAPAIMLAAYADYPADLWQLPPLDQAPHERTMGLIAADGREKSVVAAIQQFAEQARQAPGAAPRQRASLTLEVDPERYWREPQRECERLWREYVREP